MQAELGSKELSEPVLVHYAYAARYRYQDVVVQNDNFLMLAPATDHRQTAGACRVVTQPAGREVVFPDRLGNTVHRLRVTIPHTELLIAVMGEAHLTGSIVEPNDLPLSALEYGLEAEEFLTPTPLVSPQETAEAAREIAGEVATLLEAVHLVTVWVMENIAYERGSTSVSTTAGDVLASMKGVCQDKTHLALGMLRSLGIPCRYVSGLLTGQAGETHAWLEFLHPGFGWLPADPTRGVVMESGTGYLKFAVGRDYSEVPPVSGSFVSRGPGQLEAAAAKVFFDRESIAFEDAMALIQPQLDQAPT